MSPDIAIVIGVFCGVMAFVSLVSSFTTGEVPRMGALLVLVSGLMLYYATSNIAGGLSVEDIPDAFKRAFRQLVS